MSESKKIMIVDDDHDCRVMVKAILDSSGYEVVDCEGGASAIKTLESMTPDLVILDIMMPEISGYDVAKKMKSVPETQGIPVIMLTAKGDPDDLIVGYKDYGVDYYITKPFTTRQLLAGVKLVLDSSED